MARADLVVDGMLGIGGSGGLRPGAAELARMAAEGAGITVAVDVPSGVDASTGAVDGDAFPAMHTVTFGAVKLGLVVGEGRAYAGRCTSSTSGWISRRRRSPSSPTRTSPRGSRRPSATDDKYSQGVVGILAGSATYPGAGVLCTGAALRTRPGLVRYAGTAADGVRAAWPEVIVTDGRPGDAGRVQAWVVGPGMGTDDAARSVLTEVLATDLPVVVDADGLTMLAERARPGAGPERPHPPDAARPRVRTLRLRRGGRPGGRGPPPGRGPRLLGPAQGRRHGRRRRRRDGVRQRHRDVVARDRRHR